MKQVLQTISLETLANDVFLVFNIVSDYISCSVGASIDRNPYGLTLNYFKVELTEDFIGSEDDHERLFTNVSSVVEF